jgi:hypothetical protein
VLCSTGGLTATNLTPLPGAWYYLVVPLNPQLEGSYGLDGDQHHRPASISPCSPQKIGTCN